MTFFAKDVDVARKRNPSAPHTPAGKSSRQVSQGNGGSKGNIALLKAMSALSRLSDSKHDKHRRRQAELAGFSFAQGIQKVSHARPTSIVPFLPVVFALQTQLGASDDLRHSQFKINSRMLVSQQKPTSIMQLWPRAVSEQPCKRLAELYERRGGIAAIEANCRIAREMERADHELVWKLCATTLSGGHCANVEAEPLAREPPRFRRKREVPPQEKNSQPTQHSLTTLAQM